jgi:hypothetical protein
LSGLDILNKQLLDAENERKNAEAEYTRLTNRRKVWRRAPKNWQPATRPSGKITAGRWITTLEKDCGIKRD